MIGVERISELYPCQSFIDAGIIAAFSSDFPISLCDTFGGLQTAITRHPAPSLEIYEISKNDAVENPDECISFKDAIKALTINAAYELHYDDAAGSIELNKSADFILLDRDLENTPVDMIYDTKVLETVFKGKTVYKAE